MKIPADMHKWRTKFAWQMAAYAVFLFFMSGLIGWQTWFYRDKVIADPTKLLGPTIILTLGAGIAFCAAIMCIYMIFRTRGHDAKIRELERDRPPLTLEMLREELRPEKQEQVRATLLGLLRSSPGLTASIGARSTGVNLREAYEASLGEVLQRYRTELGSSPEVEIELARLQAFNESILKELHGL